MKYSKNCILLAGTAANQNQKFLINFFDQPIKNVLKTYENIKKIATGQGDDYTTGCLLDYPYFKIYYKLIAIDLSKQQKLDAEPKAIEQNGFTGNLYWKKFFIIEETKEKILNFSKGKLKYYDFISF